MRAPPGSRQHGVGRGRRRVRQLVRRDLPEIRGLGVRVQGLGFRVQGLGFTVYCVEFRV